MNRNKLGLVLVLFSLHPLAAFAGYDNIECVSAGKSVVLSDSDGAKIATIDLKTRARETYEAPVTIQPDFYATQTERTLIAIPVSPQSHVRSKCYYLHVKKKDGTECDGREFWDIRFQREYIVTGKDGDPLTYALREKKVVAGLNRDGYIHTTFSCHREGVSTAGGCFPDESAGDVVTEVPDTCMY